jgi:GNAT superfamily N-acetyltransferase
MDPRYRVREATVEDVPVLMRHLEAMFADMGVGTAASRARAAAARAPWTVARMEGGEYRSWLIEEAGDVVAGADAWLKPRQPGPANLQEVVPYVLNVYCRPEHRGNGLARRLMETIIDWAVAEGYAMVELHASEAGRPLYEHLGFVATNEMRVTLPVGGGATREQQPAAE